jgi:hypothetical protein
MEDQDDRKEDLTDRAKACSSEHTASTSRFFFNVLYNILYVCMYVYMYVYLAQGSLAAMRSRGEKRACAVA